MAKAQAFNPKFDIPNLKGKVALVTGGNTGIGLATVKHLVTNGAKVYFTARSQAKAKSTREHILTYDASVKEENLIWLPLDLADLKSVVQAANKLKSLETRLDILVNNAGMATQEPEVNDAGWEMTYAVNHMGHFTLAELLLPLIKAAAANSTTAPRIVTVTSAAAVAFIPANYALPFTSPTFLSASAKTPLVMPFRLASPIFARDIMRYSLAKLANIMVNVELQRRLDAEGFNIVCISVNPGAVKTEGGVGVWAGPMKHIMKRVMISEDEGSWNSLFAATAKDVEANPAQYRGKYLEAVGKVAPVPILERNEAQIGALWEVTKDEVNNHLAKLGLDALA